MEQQLPQELLQLLASPARENRKKGISEIVKRRLPQGVSELRKIALSDRDNDLRWMAKKAVEFLQEISLEIPASRVAVYTEHQAELKSAKEEVRNGAVQLIAASKSAAALPSLFAALATETANGVKGAIYTAMAACADAAHRQEVIAALERACLTDSVPEIRLAAAHALDAMDAREAVSVMVMLLRDESPQCRKEARITLDRWGTQAVLTAARSMLISTHIWTREAAVLAVSEIGGAEASGILTRALSDRSPLIVDRARKALAAQSDTPPPEPPPAAETTPQEPAQTASSPTPPPASPEPAEAVDPLDSPDASTRLEAIRAVMEKNDEFEARTLAVRLGVESDPYVLSALILALGRLGYVEAFPQMITYLGSTEARVRANAVEAISWLAGAALMRLVPFLSDPNNRVRANAVIACHRVHGVDVRPVLQEMLASTDPLMRRSAQFAIRTLDDPELSGLLSDAQ
jgi:HEAT repeat protein